MGNDVGQCPPFAVTGYVGDSCGTTENSVCSATCDSDNDFFTAGDGEELTMSFTCSCDRSSGSAVCDWQLTSSSPTDGGYCVECPELPELTWFDMNLYIQSVGKLLFFDDDNIKSSMEGFLGIGI